MSQFYKLFLISFISLTHHSISVADSDELKQKLEQNIKLNLLEYNQEFPNTPLQAELFDTANPALALFLNHVTETNVNEPLTTTYLKDMKVNGIQQNPFCLIGFKSNKKLISSYIKNHNLTEDEAINYLTLHELGHCFLFHHGVNRSDKENELLADYFALINIFQTNQNLAKKIVEQNKKNEPSSLYYYPNQLEVFYKNLIKQHNSNSYPINLTTKIQTILSN